MSSLLRFGRFKKEVLQRLETRTIMRIALPAFLSQASFTLTNVLDLMMVGTIGPAAIAGVGVGGVIFWNLFVLLGSPSQAVSYLCAQSYGAGRHEEFLRRVLAALAMALAVGLPVALFAGDLSVFLYRALGAEGSVVAAGSSYFVFRLIGIPFELVSTTLESMIKATGDTKRPMTIRVVSHLGNLVGNYLLIFGHFGFPRMGAAGAGLATFVSYLIAFALFLVLGGRHIAGLVKRIGFRRPHRHDFGLLVLESGKIMGNDLSASLSFLVYTGIVARLGALSLAANEIAINVASLGFLPAVGFGQASQIIIGQRIGAGHNRSARKAGLETQLYCAIFMLALGILFFFFPDLIARLYTQDEQVRAYLVPMLRLSAVFQVFDGAQIVFASSLRGAGDTTFLLLANLVTAWLFFIPLTLVIVYVLKLSVIWAWGGTYIYMLAYFAVYGIRYMRLEWDSIRARV